MFEYSPPLSWYDAPCQDEIDCHYCSEKDEKIASAADFLQGVIDQLYGEKTLDIDQLQEDLENAAHYLGLQLPQGEMNIQRRSTNFPEYLSKWIEFTQTKKTA